MIKFKWYPALEIRILAEEYSREIVKTFSSFEERKSLMKQHSLITGLLHSFCEY